MKPKRTNSKVRAVSKGEKFGSWTVIGDDPAEHRDKRAICECVCGKRKSVIIRTLVVGGSTRCQSCASKVKCLTHGYRRRGEKGSPIYHVWCSMMQRCTNPNIPSYHRYGGRGIRVCKRWNDFSVFLEDMGERPPGTQIDRIDNDGNYEPSNCRWATSAENTRNSRQTKLNTEAVKVIRHSQASSQLLASLHGVGVTCIERIRNRVTWRL